MKGILGKKLGMTQVFTKQGVLIPVTVVEVQDNVVLQNKTEKDDDYNAVVLAAFNIRKNLINKPETGKFIKAGLEPKRYVKEIKNMSGYKVGQIIKADLFLAGEFVDVTAISKGKGFAGSIKRHNYSRGPMAHGSGYHRGVGSMGSIDANRIFKSKKMPGHMGSEKVTIQNLEIIYVNAQKNTLLIKGSVPGPKKSLLIIKQAIKHHELKEANVLIQRDNKELIIIDKQKSTEINKNK